ncbi:hypothetical protein PILCRDRAFT_706134 [Piloderma croceum F 1598]|uniref:Uncharacterized protein n=1 Tax=Piloderma croceum (strain F 1598) TaxID=765440 RepID=A0A0C3EPD6_PILCF|nr:hypothetical protein PILCRDRAFT_706134 [Piloderma croceum F 1598]
MLILPMSFTTSYSFSIMCFCIDLYDWQTTSSATSGVSWYRRSSTILHTSSQL